ncbi:hypothetical protein [Luteolibacter sp. LG18]|uniref:hypothetical protein n=1 Tax=Luteolibacter sp. LG18 TaxID=2819286 RepID=UPI002B2F1B28|nr:hypothetical protein llg_11460 [Luteolibacter sp. LG18]
MIIFGTRGVTTTHEKGVFHCPSCGPGSGFRWRRVRRFFTLYFIPVIPLDLVGEFIECNQCKRTYDLRVLEYNPASEALKLEGEFHKTLRQVMLASIPATLRLDRPALVRLMELHESLGHPGVDIGRWERDAADFASSGGSLFTSLKELGGAVSDHGRETLVEAGYAAAASFNHLESAHLGDLAGALGMTPSHYHGLMKTLETAGRLPLPAESPALPA